MVVLRHRRFEKKVVTSPEHIRRAFAERLELFQNDPHHPLLNHHELSGRLLGIWSINITGDWRVWYKPLSDNTILLVNIGTHHELYGT